MRWGMFDNQEQRSDCDQAQQYEERLQLLELADDAGIYCYHVGEHHNTRLSVLSAQTVFLGAAAQRTKKLRLGTLVYVLPLHNPLRLIEEVCIADNLSNGRFEIGVGRGADSAIDWRGWGGDIEENDARFEETLEILTTGLRSEFISYSGRFFNFKDLWMQLRPTQAPHPPFWWAGNPVHAGERGMNFVGDGRSIALLSEAIAKYIREWKASPTRDLSRREEPLYGARKHVFVADTDGEALERARSAYDALHLHYFKPQPPDQEPSGYIPPPARIDFDMAIERESLIAGSAETVRDYFKRYAEGSGANYFVGTFHWGDLTHKEARHSLELFASEVMPAVP